MPIGLMNTTFLSRADLSDVLHYCAHDVEIVKEFCERTSIL